LAILTYVLIGLALRVFSFSFNLKRRLQIISRWTKRFNKFLTGLLGIKIITEGDRAPLNKEGNFIISNHLGYLDGIILGSLFGVIYISKEEVKKWPLFGWMAQVGATIFIDRRNKLGSIGYIQEVTAALKAKANILLFPEGTSTNGEKLPPFQSIHFQSPINAKSPVLPLCITYSKINSENVDIKNRDKVCWYGQVNFFCHIQQALKLHSIEARVKIYPEIEPETFSRDGYTRKELSRELYDTIAPNYPLFN